MSGPVAPTRTDPVARAMSEAIGGPVGRHGRPHRWWSPVRVLLVLGAVVMSLAITHSQPCLATNWASNEARYAKFCYSDVPYLYFGRSLVEGRWPYANDGGRYRVIEYPVGIAYTAWATAKIVQLPPLRTGPPVTERRQAAAADVYALPGIVQEVNRYFLATAVVLAACLLGATWFMAGVHRRRPWDALPFVLSPALLGTALVNWDLVAVLCVAAALWCYARGRPATTGVMLGLGTAVKLYPLFLLGPVLVLAWRRRRPLDAVIAIASAVVAWTLAQLPALLTGSAQWQVFWQFNQDRNADWGSFWLLLARHGHAVSVASINAWSWVLFGAVCLGVFALGMLAKEPPRLAQLGFLVLAGFVLVNKVYSPQYVLWLLPLAVLARPRWRDLLVWQVGETFYYVAIWLNLGGYLAGSTGDFPVTYQLAVLVHFAAVLYLSAVIVRDVLRPEHDPLRELRRGSGDLDAVDVGGGEPDPDVDLVADGRHR